jgi:hypothetical protein
MDLNKTALPGIEEDDPFQQLADEAAAALEHEAAVVARQSAKEQVDAAVLYERKRCAEVVRHALDQAAMRGLPAGSPTVRILAGIKHTIEVG